MGWWRADRQSGASHWLSAPWVRKNMRKRAIQPNCHAFWSPWLRWEFEQWIGILFSCGKAYRNCCTWKGGIYKGNTMWVKSNSKSYVVLWSIWFRCWCHYTDAVCVSWKRKGSGTFRKRYWGKNDAQLHSDWGSERGCARWVWKKRKKPVGWFEKRCWRMWPVVISEWDVPCTHKGGWSH